MSDINTMNVERNKFPGPTKDYKGIVKHFLKNEISSERDILSLLYNVPTHTTPRKFFVIIYQLYSKHTNALPILKLWILNCWHSHIKVDEKLLKGLTGFCMTKGKGILGDYLLELMEVQGQMKLEEINPYAHLLFDLQREIRLHSSYSFLEWEPSACAEQLTLLDVKSFWDLQTNEFLDQGWAEDDKEVRSPHIISLTERFNQLSFWVITSVVRAKSVNPTRVIVFFINLAIELLKLNNFHSISAIMGGLSATPVSRLNSYWAVIKSELLEKYQQLLSITDPSLGYKSLREKINEVESPYLPFIGLSLNALTLMDVGNPNKIHKRINTAKIIMIGEAIQDLFEFKKYGIYDFIPDCNILKYLSSLEEFIITDQQELYDLSRAVPPNALIAKGKKGIASLGLSNSGSIRFGTKAFSLDISYITDRILAMSYPGKKKGRHKNKKKLVQDFLDTNHKNKYQIFNLTDEPHTGFYSSIDFSIPKDSPPSTDFILVFCETMRTWLEENPVHVAVIHCTNGKDRTGFMIACYLLFCGECISASQALTLFENIRSPDKPVVTIPSHRRYVSYFESITKDLVPANAVRRALVSIKLNAIPNFQKGGGCEPWLSITSQSRNETIYQAHNMSLDNEASTIEFNIPEIAIDDDIRIDCFHRTSKCKMFSMTFNAQFVGRLGRQRFLKGEIDLACKDTKHKRFPSTFRIDIFFENIDEDIVDHEQCLSCKETINSDSPFVLNSPEGKIHFSCLKCEICGNSAKSNLLWNSDSARCAECDVTAEDSFFFRPCYKCHEPLLSDSDIRSLGNMVWHSECFTCNTCESFIGNRDVVFTQNDELLCGVCITDSSMKKSRSALLEKNRNAMVFMGEDQIDDDGEFISYADSLEKQYKKVQEMIDVELFQDFVIRLQDNIYEENLNVTHIKTPESLHNLLTLEFGIDYAFSVAYIPNLKMPQVIKIDSEELVEMLLDTKGEAHISLVNEIQEEFPKRNWLLPDNTVLSPLNQALLNDIKDKGGRFSKSAKSGTNEKKKDKKRSKTSSGRKREYQICFACKMYIENEPPVLALDSHWHQTCFRCFICSDIILDAKFLNLNGNPVCINCEDSLLKVCTGCGNKIQSTAEYFSISDDVNYHVECLKCHGCGCDFSGGGMYRKNDQLYCEDCK